MENYINVCVNFNLCTRRKKVEKKLDDDKFNHFTTRISDSFYTESNPD